MPRASGQKYHFLDHDTQIVNETPPDQNVWYEVFHEQDVRVIWGHILQENDELAAKDVETRWTIDGNVYFDDQSIEHSVNNYVYRNRAPSTGGTLGLTTSITEQNAAKYLDKRGHDFKVEVRMTSVPGTNQLLRSWYVIETLELT